MRENSSSSQNVLLSLKNSREKLEIRRVHRAFERYIRRRLIPLDYDSGYLVMCDNEVNLRIERVYRPARHPVS